MNKIIVDTNNSIIDVSNDLFIEIKSSCNLNFNLLKDDAKIIILVKNNDVVINLDLLNNKSLKINALGINSSISYNVNMKDNTNLFVVDSILSKVDSINNININHFGSNSFTNFYTNGINLSSNKLFFNINGLVNKESINSNISEISNIINIKDGNSKIIPNLIIDTKEVIANHSAFIGTFNKNDLYYLMSRGINKDDAKNLLVKSVLLNKMDIGKDIFIKEIINYKG